MASITPRFKKNRVTYKSEGERANAYNKAHMRRFIFNFHREYDKEMIEWLENHKPYQTTIKRLIVEEMKREKKKGTG